MLILHNLDGIKKHPSLIRTSREPVPMAWIQGLPRAPPPDPWLHPNINVGCALSQYLCWLPFIPTLVLAALYPNIIVGCANPNINLGCTKS
jgi:hypothetical protein